MNYLKISNLMKWAKFASYIVSVASTIFRYGNYSASVDSLYDLMLLKKTLYFLFIQKNSLIMYLVWHTLQVPLDMPSKSGHATP